MRKIFANLKSVVALAVVAAMTLSVSCMYDDTALTKRVSKVEKDLAALTERVNALENKSINDLLNGAAVITGYAKDEAGNVTLTLSNGETVTVLAEAETLQYRVTDGVLEISADGQTWVAVTAAPDAVVKKAVVNEDGTVTITLADGTEFTVAKAELIECEATRSQVYVLSESTKAVRFTINDAVEDINVMNQPFGWSATVEEYVEVEEDDFGGGIMPLAAGGKEYVLNITGPAAKLVNEGLAAKEGVVSVHFNTAAGACKVMNVAVNLAEVTLKVDATGNITITNSIVTTETNRVGMTFTDFADYYIGVMPKSLYDAYGNDALANDYDDLYAEYVNSLQTRRTSLGPVLDLRGYEEGVYEVDTNQFSLQDFAARVFYRENYFQLGQQYIVFVALDANLVNGKDHANLESAIMVPYSHVVVEATYVENSATWNDAQFNFSLAGHMGYVIGWVETERLAYLVEMGKATDTDSALNFYLESDGGPFQKGSVISGGILNTPIKLSEIIMADMLMQGWGAPSAGTEYCLFAYAFNSFSEDDLYMHNFVSENAFNLATFKTADLVAGSFDAGAKFEVLEKTEDLIAVKGTFAADVKTVAYAWFNEPTVDPEQGLYNVLNYYATEVVNFSEYITEIEASKNYPNYPIYLNVVAINANGEYVFIEQEFAVAEEPEQPAEPVDVVATGAAARYDSNNSYATIVDFQLPNEETASVAFRTGDGGWDMDLCFNKGLNYINAGQWNTYADKGTSPVWYTNSYLNGSQAEVKGAIEVGYADGAYSFTFSIGNYNVTFTGAVEGLVEPEVTSADLEQPEEGGESVDRSNINFVLCTEEGVAPVVYAGSGYCDFALWDGEKNFIRIELNDEGGYPVNGKTYPFSPDNGYDFGTMSGNGVWVCLNGVAPYSLPEYNAIVPTSGTLDVTVTDGVYTMVLDFVLPDGSKFGGTFEGAIDFK